MSASAAAIKIALLLAAKDNASTVMGKLFAKTEKQISTLEKRAKNFRDFGDSMMVAGGAGMAFFGKSIDAAEQAEKANKRLESSFMAVGNSILFSGRRPHLPRIVFGRCGHRPIEKIP